MQHIPTSHWQKPLNRVFYLLLIATLTMTTVLSVYTTAHAANETPVAVPGKLAVVGSKDAQLYNQPAGEVVRSLGAGSILTAVARSQDGQWILVMGESDQPLWAALTELVLFGSEALPIEDKNAPPSLSTASDPAPTGETASAIIAITKAGGVKLVAAPNGNLIRNLAKGESLTALGRSEDGRWLVVQTSDQVTGWVEVSRLETTNLAAVTVIHGDANATASKIQDEPHTSVKAQQITAEVKPMSARLNVRNGPGTAYKIIDKVQAGVVLTVVEQDVSGEWVQIIIPSSGQMGWVSSRYVEINTKL